MIYPEPLIAQEAFQQRLARPLSKQPISTLQINLGRRCNLACHHCHVEAGPHRTEELTPDVCGQLLQLIERFPQIQTVDLTGGAPEMLYGFKPIVEAARSQQKQVIVRSNLTIYFEAGFGDIPEYCAQQQVHIAASLPCYLAENVDRMRGQSVFERSIQALQWLNHLGYGQTPQLMLDLVYNPPVPQGQRFMLPPPQASLEQDYKTFLGQQFGIDFNRLLTITNLPLGRTQFQLEHHQLYQPYLQFLADHFNPATVPQLMCRHQLSIDYQGHIYDCDFNQMAARSAQTTQGQSLTVAHLLAADSLDLISEIQTAPYCFGCTAGSGSSCGGTLV